MTMQFVDGFLAAMLPSMFTVVWLVWRADPHQTSIIDQLAALTLARRLLRGRDTGHDKLDLFSKAEYRTPTDRGPRQCWDRGPGRATSCGGRHIVSRERTKRFVSSACSGLRFGIFDFQPIARWSRSIKRVQLL